MVTPGSKARHHMNGPRHAVGGWRWATLFVSTPAPAGAVRQGLLLERRRDAAPVVVGGRLWSFVIAAAARATSTRGYQAFLQIDKLVIDNVGGSPTLARAK